jgi:small subunit ribosomal protein S6
MSLHEYEMMYILRPDLDEEGVAASMAKVSGLVTSNGGEVTKSEPWGRRRLAYPIKQCRDGQYVLMQYKLDPKASAEVERTLRISEEVIRYLIIRLDD